MAIDFPSSPTNGQVYTDSTSGMTWVYSTTDTAWSASFNRSNYVSQTFTATAGQTSFTVSGGYLPSLVEVYQNGVLLVNGTDVTVTSGTVVVLAVGATSGDIIQVLGNQTFNYAATVPASKGGTGLTSPGAAGNVLTSDGTNWYSGAGGAQTGEIITSTAASKTDYLKCDGSIYNRSSYSALATAIGTPLMPKDTLGNALSTYQSSFVLEANGLLVRNGTVLNTSAPAPAVFANALATSTDGITWTQRTGLNIYSDQIHNNFAYGNSRYVLMSRHSNYNNMVWLVSTDGGVTWTKYAATPIGNDINAACDIVFGGTSNRFVRLRTAYSNCCGGWLSSYAYLEYSTDGVTWTAGHTNTAATSYTFGYNNCALAGYSGGFVAVEYNYNSNLGAYNNYVLYSADGATWSDITANVNSVAAFAGSMTGCSYVNGRFIITTSGGQIFTSTTGASGSWSLLTSTNTVATGKIRGNANAYVVNNSYSTDLLNWVTPINYGLGTIAITATPSTGTRFYGTVSGNGSYYSDLYNYTTATQFPVPFMSTRGTYSSPYYGTSTPTNFFIKT